MGSLEHQQEKQKKSISPKLEGLVGKSWEKATEEDWKNIRSHCSGWRDFYVNVEGFDEEDPKGFTPGEIETVKNLISFVENIDAGIRTKELWDKFQSSLQE